jgi:hypothetical protein
MIPLLALYNSHHGEGGHSGWHTILIGFSVIMIAAIVSYWWATKE